MTADKHTSFFRKKWVRFIQTAVVAVIIVYVIRQNGGARMLETMTEARIQWMVFAGACFFLSIVLGACQWFLLLKYQGLHFSLSRCFKVYYLGMFMNALLFNMAGDALRVYKLKKVKADFTIGFTATFADRYIGFLVLSLFSVIAIAFISLSGNLNQKYFHSISIVCLIFFMGFSLSTLALVSSHISRVVRYFLGILRLRSVEIYYEKIQGCLVLYRKKWKSMFLVFFLSCGIHTLRILGHYFCAPALGIDIDLYYFFAFIPIISITMLIPLNVGGWGLPQGIGIALYSIPGVMAAVEGIALTEQADVRIASGALTFLPSIIFYMIMLLGGFFISTGLDSKKTISDGQDIK